MKANIINLVGPLMNCHAALLDISTLLQAPQTGSGSE